MNTKHLIFEYQSEIWLILIHFIDCEEPDPTICPKFLNLFKMKGNLKSKNIN